MKLKIYYSILCIAITTPLFSATIYTGADLGSITSGSISDYQRNPANHVAAKFSITNSSSEIKAVSFYGLYFEGGADPGVTTDTFDLVFFTDGGNGPDSIIGSAQQSLVAERELTGQDGVFGNPIYRYELNLSSSVTLSSGSYWLAISRNNPAAPAGTGGAWLWAGDHTGGPANQSQSGNQFSFSGTNNASPAFTVEDTQFVPEPGSLFLGAMATAIGISRRRR